MKRLLWVCCAVAASYAILTIATILRFRIGQAPDETGAVLWALLPVQIALVLLCLVAARPTGWGAIGFAKIRWSGALWLLPSIAVMIP